MTLTSKKGVVVCCDVTYDLTSVDSDSEGGGALRQHIEHAHGVPYTKAREAIAALRRDYATVRTIVI